MLGSVVILSNKDKSLFAKGTEGFLSARVGEGNAAELDGLQMIDVLRRANIHQVDEQTITVVVHFCNESERGTNALGQGGERAQLLRGGEVWVGLILATIRHKRIVERLGRTSYTP